MRESCGASQIRSGRNSNVAASGMAGIVGGHLTCEFMRENLSHGFPSLKNTTLRMLRSPHPDLRRAGAQLVCLAAFAHEDARELAAEARQGDCQQRLGVADVASANVADPICRQWCEGALTHLFDDSDLEVRNLAALCFRHLPEDRLSDYGDLIQAFCDSPSYKEDPFFLLNALERARGLLPGVVCLACESFLDHLASEARTFFGRGTNLNDGGGTSVPRLPAAPERRVEITRSGLDRSHLSGRTGRSGRGFSRASSARRTTSWARAAFTPQCVGSRTLRTLSRLLGDAADMDGSPPSHASASRGGRSRRRASPAQLATWWTHQVQALTPEDRRSLRSGASDACLAVWQPGEIGSVGSPTGRSASQRPLEVAPPTRC